MILHYRKYSAYQSEHHLETYLVSVLYVFVQTMKVNGAQVLDPITFHYEQKQRDN